MAKESSFDIVSKVDFSEVQNAVNMAMKEIQNRYDFKGSSSDIKLEGEELVLISDDEFKMNQLKDVLISKLIRRNVRQRAKLVSGIDKDNAKKINTLIKNSKLKVKSQIQDDQIRVSGKSKDDLQKVIAIIREADLPIDVQFVNFR